MVSNASKETSQHTIELVGAPLFPVTPGTVCEALVGGEPNRVEIAAGCPEHRSEAVTRQQCKLADWVAIEHAVKESCVSKVGHLEMHDTFF